MRNKEYYRKHKWRLTKGYPETSRNHLLEELRETQWNSFFEKLMRNRLVMGALRYGKIGAKNKPAYKRVKSMHQRLLKYTKTGNKELLVDVANLCLLEFTECHHPEAHFKAIDDGQHVEVICS